MKLPENWPQWTENLAGEARRAGWNVHEAGLLELRWNSDPSAPVCHLSAGIHGDEPAGPLAIEQLIQKPEIFSGWQVICYPAINLHGLERGRREGAEGVDLNRDYQARSSQAVRLHVDRLQHWPAIHLALCLHEDWETRGVYLYYLHHGQSAAPARQVLAAMNVHLPVETAPEIDGRPADQGLIAAHIEDRSINDWPEAVYLARNHKALCYTFETPSSRPLELRVRAQIAGILAALAAHRPA